MFFLNYCVSKQHVAGFKDIGTVILYLNGIKWSVINSNQFVMCPIFTCLQFYCFGGSIFFAFFKWLSWNWNPADFKSVLIKFNRFKILQYRVFPCLWKQQHHMFFLNYCVSKQHVAGFKDIGTVILYLNGIKWSVINSNQLVMCPIFTCLQVYCFGSSFFLPSLNEGCVWRR